MKKFLGTLLILLVIVSCTDMKVKDLEDINAMEKNLFDSLTLTPNIAKADSLVNAYLAFAKKYPQDSNTVNFLFKAAEIKSNIGNPAESITILEGIINNYGDHKLIPTVMHYEGFLYEERIQDTAKAHEVYQKLIDKYPNSELAESAKACIQNLGKTPEEIIRGFEEQQNKIDSAANTAVKN